MNDSRDIHLEIINSLQVYNNYIIARYLHSDLGISSTLLRPSLKDMQDVQLSSKQAIEVLELCRVAYNFSLQELEHISKIICNNKMQALTSPLDWIRNWDKTLIELSSRLKIDDPIFTRMSLRKKK